MILIGPIIVGLALVWSVGYRASADEHRCLAQIFVTGNLLDKEIGNVGTGDGTGAPVGGVEHDPIAVRCWTIRQDDRPGYRPGQIAGTDQVLLHVLVVVDATKDCIEAQIVKASTLIAAITRTEAC